MRGNALRGVGIAVFLLLMPLAYAAYDAGSDIDKSGCVDSLDLALVARCIGSSVSGECADADVVNGDGKVDNDDYQAVLQNQGCLTAVDEPSEIPGIQPGEIPKVPAEEPTCTDTDGGINYSIKGTATLAQDHEDYCDTLTYLWEYSCGTSITKGGYFYVNVNGQDRQLQYKGTECEDNAASIAKIKDSGANKDIVSRVSSGNTFAINIGGKEFTFEVSTDCESNDEITLLQQPAVLKEYTECSSGCYDGACIVRQAPEIVDLGIVEPIELREDTSFVYNWVDDRGIEEEKEGIMLSARVRNNGEGTVDRFWVEGHVDGDYQDIRFGESLAAGEELDVDVLFFPYDKEIGKTKDILLKLFLQEEYIDDYERNDQLEDTITIKLLHEPRLEMSLATEKSNYITGEAVTLTDPPEGYRLPAGASSRKEGQFARITDPETGEIITLNEYDLKLLSGGKKSFAFVNSHDFIENEIKAKIYRPKGHIIEFNTMSVLDKKHELEAAGLPASEIAEKLQEHRKQIRQEHAEAKEEIAKVTGIELKESSLFKIMLVLFALVVLAGVVAAMYYFFGHKQYAFVMLVLLALAVFAVFKAADGGITGAAVGQPEGKLIGEYTDVFNGIALDIDAETAQKLEGLSHIKKALPNNEVKLSLMDSVSQIGADYAWQHLSEGRPLIGEGITIAVIDTGVDYTHPDLGRCLGKRCKVIGGYDFVNYDKDPMDDQGHGTHVAATAAGAGILYGVAPGAKILAYKVLDKYGSGSMSAVIEGIERALDPNLDGNYDDKADIISLSLGAGCWGYDESCGPDDPISKAIDRVVDEGIVAVVAAGNEGPSQGSIGSPGTARNAITVGAVDKENQIAYFSSRGPVEWTDADGNLQRLDKPDVMAPGVDICAAQYKDAFTPRAQQCVDRGHVAISGTSMATPHVSGLVALMLQQNPALTPTGIKEMLKVSAVSIPGSGPKNAKIEYQPGIVNSIASLGISEDIVIKPAQAFVLGDTIEITVKNKGDAEKQFSVEAFVEGKGIKGTKVSENTLNIGANDSASFDVTVEKNIEKMGSSGVYFGGAIIRADNFEKAVPLKFIVPDLVNISGDITSETCPDCIAPLYSMDFGLFEPSKTTWQSTKTLKLENKKSAGLKYSVNVECCDAEDKNGNELGKFKISSSYRKTAAVPASGSFELPITLKADADDIPNGIYSGTVSLTDPSGRKIEIPFKFVKYYVANLEFSGIPITVVTHQSGENKEYHFIQGSGGVIYLDKPGEHDFIALMVKDNQWYYVIKEKVDVSRPISLQFDISDAGNKVGFKYVDERGIQINTGDKIAVVDLYYSGSIIEQIQGIFYFGNVPELLFHSSDASQNYEYDLAVQYLHNDDVYTLTDNLKGVNAGHIPRRTADELTRFTTEFHPNNGKDSFLPRYWIQSRGMGIGKAFGLMSRPFRKDVVFNRQSIDDNGYVFFEIEDLEQDQFWPVTLYRSQLIGNKGKLALYRFNYPLDPSYIEDLEGTNHVGLNPEFWSARFDVTAEGITSVVPGFWKYGVFSTQMHDLIPWKLFDYELYRDGLLIDSGTAGYMGIFGLDYPGEHKLIIRREYHIQDNAYQGTGEAVFDNTREDMSPPYITVFRLFTDGERTDSIVPLAENELIFNFADQISEVDAEAYIDIGFGYQRIELSFTDEGDYLAKIPVPDDTALYRLKITGKDASGNSLSYEFEVPLKEKPQSKLSNTDSVSHKGKIIIDIEKEYEGGWIFEKNAYTGEAVYVGSMDYVKLDELFNGKYSAGQPGMYRVYAKFADADGKAIIGQYGAVEAVSKFAVREAEICDDGIDNDKDMFVDSEDTDCQDFIDVAPVPSPGDPGGSLQPDLDGDGFSEPGGDCDDDASDDPEGVSCPSAGGYCGAGKAMCAYCINPGMFDGCDGIDNDCDGNIDEDYAGNECFIGDRKGNAVCEGGSVKCNVPPIVCQGPSFEQLDRYRKDSATVGGNTEYDKCDQYGGVSEVFCSTRPDGDGQILRASTGCGTGACSDGACIASG